MKMTIRYIALFLVFLSFHTYARQQNITVSGIIRDAETGETLPGTSISIPSKQIGIISDRNGYYALNVETGMAVKIEFSFLGYINQAVNFNPVADTTINIMLEPSTINIDEVRVSSQRNFWGNMDKGRSIGTIDSKKIELVNTNNAADVLQASVSGVWTTNSSGAPGDHQKVRIRGINTIFGCADPLYIIDGVAVPIVNLHSLGIADLNIHDIEHVTVLKDAASTALYGYQGGNGVVVIDTKQKMENTISFSTKFGLQKVPSYINLLSTPQFLATLDSSVPEINTAGTVSRYPENDGEQANTNWQEELFQIGTVNEYQLAGGRQWKKTSFYVSGNYYKQKGIIRNSSYEKYAINAKVDHTFFKKLTLSMNFRGARQDNQNNIDVYNGSNLLLESINKSPCMLTTTDSMYYYYSSIPGVAPTLARRNYYDYRTTVFHPEYGMPMDSYPYLNNQEYPDSLLNQINYSMIDRNGAFNIRAKFFITDKLFINASSSVSMKERRYTADIQHYVFYESNNYMKSTENFVLLSQQINLNYLNDFGDHHISVVGGYRNYADNACWNLDTIYDAYNVQQTWMSNSLVINNEKASTIREISALAIHASYNYKNKYFLSLLGNYEKLVVNKDLSQSQLFPSVAANWDISKENFLNGINWINKIDLFANYGISGNYPINALSKDFYDTHDYLYLPETLVSSKTVEQFTNHHLKSEIVHEINYGINFSLIKNRLIFRAELYNKTNENLALIRDIPLSYGGGKALVNIGKVTNSGRELSIEVIPVQNSKFYWSSHYIFSSNTQLVKELGEEDIMEFTNESDILIPKFVVSLDQEIGVIKGFEYLGNWTDEDEQLNDITTVNIHGSKFRNVDTTNAILNRNDMITIGKTLPDFTWSWNNLFSYKNLSIECLWYAVVGVDKYNATRASTYMSGLNEGVTDFVERGDNAISNKFLYQSSFFVEDASFVRLKRLTFSYLFSKPVFGKAQLSLSLSFNNLICFTSYSGYDPEASIFTDNTFSDLGIDRGAYPNSKSVYFRINLNL